MTKTSAIIHKWLALLMAIQILFWFVSGLFFAAFPIERVRSEHAIAAGRAEPVALDAAAPGWRGWRRRGWRPQTKSSFGRCSAGRWP